MKKERQEAGLNKLINIGICNLHVVLEVAGPHYEGDWTPL